MKLLEFDKDKIANPAMVQVLMQIDKHAVETNNRLSSIETKMEVIGNAFPDHDFEGHRRYHQALIEALEEKKRLYRSLKEKTFIGILWAAIVWLGIAAWHEIVNIITTPK
jgi:hypothetical protein